MEYKKIPSKIRLGGQDVEVKIVDRCSNTNAGESSVYEGGIDIAENINKDTKQSESSKVNTFYHELTHCILQTMGEHDLNENEKFVCCFAGFLADAMDKAYFQEGE